MTALRGLPDLLAAVVAAVFFLAAMGCSWGGVVGGGWGTMPQLGRAQHVGAGHVW